MRTFWSVFTTLFLAEVGDKTQLAVVAFAADQGARWTVFFAASAALTLSTGLAVLAGSALTRLVPAAWLQLAAALAFILVGVFLLREALPGVLGRGA